MRRLALDKLVEPALYLLAFARALPLILLNQPRAFLWYLDFSFLALPLTLFTAARILALILAIIDLNLDLAIFFPFALSMATWALALAMKPLAFAFSLALMAFTLALALETCFFTNLLAAATFFLAKAAIFLKKPPPRRLLLQKPALDVAWSSETSLGRSSRSNSVMGSTISVLKSSCGMVASATSEHATYAITRAAIKSFILLYQVTEIRLTTTTPRTPM